MSKTDKTRPWRVRVMDRKTWLEEVHDHTDGECDLPQRPALVCDFWKAGRGTRCRWGASTEFWRTPSNYCGCPICNDQIGRRTKTKRQREAARRHTREAFKDISAHGIDDPLDDIDTAWGREKRWTEEFGGDFDAEMADLAALGEPLDLPPGAHVVDALYDDHYDATPQPYAVEILYNDGRRETRYLPGWHVDPITGDPTPYEPAPDALERFSEKMHGPR